MRIKLVFCLSTKYVLYILAGEIDVLVFLNLMSTEFYTPIVHFFVVISYGLQEAKITAKLGNLKQKEK